MLYYNKTSTRVLKELHSDKNGLGTSAVRLAEKKYGKNVITVEKKPLWQQILEPFTNIFVIILLIAAIISFAINERTDAYVILAIIAINIGIDLSQKASTSRILKALKNQAVQEVTVKRNMEMIKIKEYDLVPGDIVLLVEGNTVPADMRIIESGSLSVDESSLTGESLPIAKNEHALRGIKNIYEQTNMLFQGTFIKSGNCTGVVCATGNNTQFSKIAKLATTDAETNPIQKKITKLVRQIIIGITIITIFIFVILVLRGENILESLRFVLALAVSAVPEGLPLTISIILAIGMRTMSRHNALVTNMRSLEVVGSVNVVATDKTGTLSKNKLVIQELWQAPFSAVSLKINEMISLAQTRTEGLDCDPLDEAIKQFTKNQPEPSYKLLKTLPFVQDLMLSGNIYQDKKSNKTIYLHAIKGSPEKIINFSDLTEEEREQSLYTLNHFTSQGYRVIALALMSTDKKLSTLKQIINHSRMQLVGFIAIADELRLEAKPAIKTLQGAGISVDMITGDHANTALTIGKSLGIATKNNQVLDSSELDKVNQHSISSYRVFSRIMPEDKFHLLSLLKRGNIVAMTGDGVNDAPALANAHVGLAMGSGSQIAKDASDIILLDNNFNTVATAIKEGRVIIDNIKRVIVYLLSTNIGEVITIAIALLIGWPVPLLPIQILWVNIVTDTTMVISLGVEPGEPNIMTRKPTSPNAPLLSKFMLSQIIITALVIALVTLSFFGYYLQKESIAYAQSAAFLALVVTQWANAFAMRSHLQPAFSRIKVKNNLFWGMLILSIAIQLIALETPISALLHITPLAAADFITILIISTVVPLLISEAQKHIVKRHQLLS